MSAHLQQFVLEKIDQCYHNANHYFDRNFPRPSVIFNQRGKIAGCARLQANQIRINPVLLADNLTEFLNEVIPHEVCHLLAYQLYGQVKPHGKEWQALMQILFNLKGETFHKMDVSKVAGKTFPYSCLCGETTLSIRRHNKVQRGQQQYLCRTCGQNLVQAATIHN